MALLMNLKLDVRFGEAVSVPMWMTSLGEDILSLPLAWRAPTK
jgi:hypothetical protein